MNIQKSRKSSGVLQSSHANTAIKIAAFDVDGTLTFTDSFLLFLRFTTTRIGFLIRLFIISPVFIAYLAKLIKRDTAKNQLLSVFLKGMSEKEYNDKCQSFADFVYSKIIHSDAIDYIKSEQARCDEVALVSASLSNYLEPFAKMVGIKHTIATRIEIENGFLTGRMAGFNCRGIEKCNRIYDYFGDCIIDAAYGDSAGDKEMLEIANRPNFRIITKKPENYRQIIRKLYWGF